MTKYHFYEDRLVRTHERTHFSVNAEDHNRAIERVRSFSNRNVCNHENDDDIEILSLETLSGYSLLVPPSECGGDATLTVYDAEDNSPIADNSCHSDTADNLTIHLLFGDIMIERYNRDGIIPFDCTDGAVISKTFETQAEKRCYLNALDDYGAWDDTLLLTDTTPSLDKWWVELDRTTKETITGIVHERETDEMEHTYKINKAWSVMMLCDKKQLYDKYGILIAKEKCYPYFIPHPEDQRRSFVYSGRTYTTMGCFKSNNFHANISDTSSKLDKENTPEGYNHADFYQVLKEHGLILETDIFLFENRLVIPLNDTLTTFYPRQLYITN